MCEDDGVDGDLPTLLAEPFSVCVVLCMFSIKSVGNLSVGAVADLKDNGLFLVRGLFIIIIITQETS